MAQSQGQYSNGNDYIKDRNTYWPGHITAECLIEDTENAIELNELKSNLINKSKNSTGQQQKIDLQNENKELLKSFKLLTKLKPGSAFSAVIGSMIPYDYITKTINNMKLNNDQLYDEFGFKLINENDETQDEDEDDEDSVWSKTVKINKPRNIFIEDSKHKLKWIAYLEFTLNADIGNNFSWDQVVSLNKCEKMKLMIRGQGIPHSLRPFVWMRFSGALSKKINSKFKYLDLIKDNSDNEQLHSFKQIEKDLLRTLPTNACFTSQTSVGVPRLRRILQSLARLYPNIGYCQGMGTIAATLLLFVEEEDAFWLMCSIIEDILPASYYSHTLIGVQADMKVLRQLVQTYLPEIEQQFKVHDIELSLICINWFLTIYSNVFEIKILLRIWDLFFYDGSTAMFQICLAMLQLNETKIIKAQNSAQIFSILSEIPANITDVDSLIETSIRIASSVNKNQVDTIRRKHQAYLMAQNGAIVNPSNYQNLPLSKEKPRLKNLDSQKSNFLNNMFKKTSSQDINNNNNGVNNNEQNHNKQIFSHESESNEIKMKNIVQTELLVSLREVIVRIGQHFQQYDPEKFSKCDLNADYSVESHSNDLENYMDNSQIRKFKRAKAIMDFDKTDDDELGFRKNDIITVLSSKDDHCWIGELNGEKGWFPTRFVTVIDERNGKIYSSAGDDSINDRIRDLIKNEFCTILKSIFENGQKKWSVMGSSIQHPWLFIEEAAKKSVEKDFGSVYSRLVLCKTYRLDEDGKVLSPDELLFKSVQLINLNHHQSLDMKFRSLICIGLNEQVLHIWLETLCSTIESVEKWYNHASFIRSPGWVQIKCELRVLAQFSFLLNSDADLKKEIAINECITGMKLLTNTRLLISLFLIVGLCINEFTYCQNQNDDEEEETNQDETNQDEESSGNGATGGNDEVASNNQLQIKTEKIITTTRQAAPKKVTVAVNLDEPVTDQQALDDISDSNEDEDTNDDNETNDEEEDSNNNNNNNNNEQEQEVEQIKQQQPVDVSSTVMTPPFKSSRSKLLSIISKPGILAGIVGGAIIGILTAILLIMFIVYRMRKKDEGSYALEETKKPLNAYDYRHCPTKEFYA